MADKAGAVGQRQRFDQRLLRFALALLQPVQLVAEQQVAVEIAHQPQPAGVLVQFIQHHAGLVILAEQNLHPRNVAPLALREVVVRHAGLFGVAQPLGGGGGVAGHLPVDHP